jgi:hypothetical protein
LENGDGVVMCAPMGTHPARGFLLRSCAGVIFSLRCDTPYTRTGMSGMRHGQDWCNRETETSFTSELKKDIFFLKNIFSVLKFTHLIKLHDNLDVTFKNEIRSSFAKPVLPLAAERMAILLIRKSTVWAQSYFAILRRNISAIRNFYHCLFTQYICISF